MRKKKDNVDDDGKRKKFDRKISAFTLNRSLMLDLPSSSKSLKNFSLYSIQISCHQAKTLEGLLARADFVNEMFWHVKEISTFC